MFYNCENLMFSSGHTYEKLNNLTRVIVAAGGGMPPAIIGLAEVENDSIMNRWTKHTPLSRWHYRYVITDAPDARGINVALMYQPQDFRLLGNESFAVKLPKEYHVTRNLLHVWGRVVNGDTLDVIVCHLPSRFGGKKVTDKARSIAHNRLRHVMDSLSEVRLNPHLIVMGDMNDYPDSKSMVGDFAGYDNMMFTLQNALKNGKLSYGTHKYRGEWGYLDQFIVNKSLLDTANNHISVRNARSFALPFMLVPEEKHLGVRPKRSRYGYKYEGGYSDHLPILLDLQIPPLAK